ncbi:MAG: hypothetical protein J3Q66DRAFT_351364 [Benniella sp.]|nr:MAG: hypothetical protein J3Q66DRAFT_351364 [Benniella sp.]
MNVIDLFPTHVQSHVPEHELPPLLMRDVATSSALVIDLPLRYVFQYALNHLRKDARHRTVLIVVDSKTKLKSLMRQEHDPRRQQKRHHSLHRTQGLSQKEKEEEGVHSSSSVTDPPTGTVDPWQHLFLPLGGGSTQQDEFTSSTLTQTLTQQTPTATQQQISSQSDQQLFQDGGATSSGNGFSAGLVVKEEEFQPELWSRIQIRYAPTVHHVQSLFRCLHLNSETTSGVTFGSDLGQAHNPVIIDLDQEEAEERFNGQGGMKAQTKNRRPLSSSTSMPTMVMLIGCFGDREFHDDEVQGIDPSTLCVLPSHLPYTGGNTNVSVDDPSIAMTTSRTTTVDPSTQTPLQALATRRTAEDQERLDYIRAVSQAMSEIKDSLDWIERASGQKVELLVLEDSGASAHVQDTIPRPFGPRELWLQQVIGFWIDTIAVVEPRPELIHHSPQSPDPIESKESRAEQASVDSLCLWVTSQQNVQANIPHTTVRTTDASGVVGAVVGLSWVLDGSKDCFQFQVLS